MFTCRLETIKDTLPELTPLLWRHFQEVKPHAATVLAPRYGAYLSLENAGGTMLVVLREDGNIVGYWVGFIGPELHHEHVLSATTDIFWTAKKAKGLASLALRLFRGVEKELKFAGVVHWYTDLPLHQHYGQFLTSMGHVPISMYFCKTLGG